MKTQITLNKNNEIEKIILPDGKYRDLYKLYSCLQYGMRLNMTFKGLYNDDQLISVEELRTIYTNTNDLKKAIKQDLLKVYNTTDDLKSAYLNAGGDMGWWEHDITDSYEDFKEQAQTTALHTIPGLSAYEKKHAEERMKSSALNASESALIDAYAFTLLSKKEQREAIKKSLKADDYKREEARRLSAYLLEVYIEEYSKCDYIKQLLSIQDIMQSAFKAGYKTLKVKLTNGTYQKIDIETNKDLGHCWGGWYRQNIDSVFYGADIKLNEIEQIIYKKMILWEAK